MADALLAVLGLGLLVFFAYVVVRVMSIAHYRTRAEYDERFVAKLKSIDGESDAKN
jgi:hypothetical protein